MNLTKPRVEYSDAAKQSDLVAVYQHLDHKNDATQESLDLKHHTRIVNQCFGIKSKFQLTYSLDEDTATFTDRIGGNDEDCVGRRHVVTIPVGQDYWFGMEKEVVRGIKWVPNEDAPGLNIHLHLVHNVVSTGLSDDAVDEFSEVIDLVAHLSVSLEG